MCGKLKKPEWELSEQVRRTVDWLEIKYFSYLANPKHWSDMFNLYLPFSSDWVNLIHIRYQAESRTFYRLPVKRIPRCSSYRTQFLLLNILLITLVVCAIRAPVDNDIKDNIEKERKKNTNSIWIKEKWNKEKKWSALNDFFFLYSLIFHRKSCSSQFCLSRSCSGSCLIAIIGKCFSTQAVLRFVLPCYWYWEQSRPAIGAIMIICSLLF